MRLIDADALANKLIEQFSRKKDLQSEVILNTMLWKLNQAPSVDGEPVVRCKDCEHWDVSKNEYSICCHAYHNMMMVRSDGMGFCSDGERKDNG